MKQFSLTGRITATVIVCQLLLTAALTFATVLFGREQLRLAFDERLHGRAMSTLALVRYSETKPFDLLFDTELLPPSSDTVHQDLFEIRKSNGQALAQSAQIVPPSAEQAEKEYVDFTLAGVPYRAVIQ